MQSRGREMPFSQNKSPVMQLFLSFGTETIHPELRCLEDPSDTGLICVRKNDGNLVTANLSVLRPGLPRSPITCG